MRANLSLVVSPLEAGKIAKFEFAANDPRFKVSLKELRVSLSAVSVSAQINKVLIRRVAHRGKRSLITLD